MLTKIFLQKGSYACPSDNCRKKNTFLAKMRSSNNNNNKQSDFNKGGCEAGDFVDTECDRMRMLAKSREAGDFVDKSFVANKGGCEAGDFVDNMGVLFVMVFVFALLLSFMSYAKIVLMKLDVDHIAKRYLYVMEQYGYLPADINGNTEESIKNDLGNAGCDPDTFELKEETQYGESEQVEYGHPVTLSFYVRADNPFYTYLHGDPNDNWFFQEWINQYIDINVSVESTSKW